MKAWSAGDPIGMGEVYLPTKKTRDAYGKACSEAQINSAAALAIELPTLAARRAFIDTYPASRRDALKARIKTLWENRNGALFQSQDP